MEMMSRSLRIDRGSSLSSSSSWRRLQRSSSLLLASEMASDSGFAAEIPGAYQRLSKSMRVSSDSGGGFLGCKPVPMNLSKRIANHWADKLGKLFSFKKIHSGGQVEVAVAMGEEKSPEVEVGRQKKRSSWLPDPDRRWPVQGW